MTKLTDVINSRTNQVTLEGTRTNWVDVSSNITVNNSGGGNSAITFAEAQISERAGKYYMHIDVKTDGAGANSSTIDFTFDNVTFSGSEHNKASWQVYPLGATSKSDAILYINANTFLRAEDVVGASMSGCSFNVINIPLASKPTWFAANLQTASGIPVATSGNYGVIDYDEATIVLDNNFTTGTLKLVRVGKMVTMSSESSITHSNVHSPASSAGIIPVGFRPVFDYISNVIFYDDTAATIALIQANGTFNIQHRSETTPVARTAVNPLTMSWTVP